MWYVCTPIPVKDMLTDVEWLWCNDDICVFFFLLLFNFVTISCALLSFPSLTCWAITLCVFLWKCISSYKRFLLHTCVSDWAWQKCPAGPGSYGKGGIPSSLLDERRARPTGTCCTMDFSAGVERFPEGQAVGYPLSVELKRDLINSLFIP